MKLYLPTVQDFLIGSAIFAVYFGWAYWRSRKPRYVVDERGERQRVIEWNRGQPVYDPKTWQQRLHEEVIVRRDRRKWIWGGLFWAGLVLAITAWLDQFGSIVSTYVFWCLAVSSAPIVGKFIPAVLQEIAYQLGYQGMQGAKVLDGQPKAQPGREVVEEQKAHGDARVASEAEALHLLNARK
jgi:hypothetical protein